MRPPDHDRTLDLSIERLTFGADALARHDGHVVFVPLAAPGDRVRARVERRRGYLRAELRRRGPPGPGSRRAAAAPCSGAAAAASGSTSRLAAQRRAKEAIVAEQLARLGGLRDVDVRPTLAAPDGLALSRAHHPRRRGPAARLPARALARARGGRRRARSPIRCVDAHLERRARLGRHACATAPTRVTIAAAPGGVVLVAALPAPPVPPDVAAAEALLADQRDRPRRRARLGAGDRVVVGDPTVRVELEPGLALEVPADVFTQVNPAANRLLVATVLELGELRGRRGGARPLLRRRQLRAAARAPRRAGVHGIERDAPSRSPPRARTPPGSG